MDVCRLIVECTVNKVQGAQRLRERRTKAVKSNEWQNNQERSSVCKVMDFSRIRTCKPLHSWIHFGRFPGSDDRHYQDSLSFLAIVLQ